MAGEYQLAQKVLDDGLEAAAANGGMHAETFTRALIHQIIEHDVAERSQKDVISVLEHFIRMIEDGDSAVVSRGC